MTPPNAETLDVAHVIAVAPERIFAVLVDPSRHRDTEPGDWVRDAVDRAPITGVGDVFAMNMFLVHVGGEYVMHNLVTEFEQDHLVAWMPGTLDADGTHNAGGWVWRYELTPVDSGTEVRLTYDWTSTPTATRERMPQWPPFGRGFLHRSLDTLEASLSEVRTISDR